jgi:hypothetical protein
MNLLSAVEWFALIIGKAPGLLVVLARFDVVFRSFLPAHRVVSNVHHCGGLLAGFAGS